MSKCEHKIINEKSSGFPVFTLIAGLLLVAKLTAYPEISWAVIIAVWTVPLTILILIISLGLCCAGLIYLFSIVFK